MSKLSACALAGAMMVGARTAAADVSSETSAKANNLFEAAQRLVAAGKIDHACESFAESLAIDPQPGTRLNLADCREKQGRLVEAYELFAIGIEEATRAKKAGRLAFARERVQALAKRLVGITLAVATPALAGLVVQIDGHEVPRARWARGMRREPRKLVVTASAPGHEPFRVEVNATAGDQLVVEIPALVPVDGEVAASPSLDARVSLRPLPERSRNSPFVIGGMGGALALAGVSLGLHARSRYHEELDRLAPDLNRRLDGAQREADVATVLGIAGAVTIAAGVVLYVRDRRDRVQVTPTANMHGAGVAVTGALW